MSKNVPFEHITMTLAVVVPTLGTVMVSLPSFGTLEARIVG